MPYFVAPPKADGVDEEVDEPDDVKEDGVDLKEEEEIDEEEEDQKDGKSEENVDDKEEDDEEVFYEEDEDEEDELMVDATAACEEEEEEKDSQKDSVSVLFCPFTAELVWVVVKSTYLVWIDWVVARRRSLSAFFASLWLNDSVS